MLNLYILFIVIIIFSLFIGNSYIQKKSKLLKTSVPTFQRLGFCIGFAIVGVIIYFFIIISKSIYIVSLLSSLYLGGFITHIFRCIYGKKKLRQSDMKFNDRSIIIGGVIASLIDLGICIASYFFQNSHNTDNSHTHSLFDPLIGGLASSFLFLLPVLIVFGLGQNRSFVVLEKTINEIKSSPFKAIVTPVKLCGNIITSIFSIDLFSERMAASSTPGLLLVSVAVFGFFVGLFFVRPHLISFISFTI
jgi:hypothetical protein